MTNLNKKVVLIGDQATGKTTFLTKIRTGEFIENWSWTMGLEIRPIKYNDYTFNVWDIGSKKNFGLGDGYYIQSDACLVFCDLTNKSTVNSTVGWISGYIKVVEKGPIILIGTHSDKATDEQKEYFRSIANQMNLPYCEIDLQHEFEIPFKKLREEFEK